MDLFNNNKCKFAEDCPNYQEDSKAYNNENFRFLSFGKVYCGTYRQLSRENTEGATT